MKIYVTSVLRWFIIDQNIGDKAMHTLINGFWPHLYLCTLATYVCPVHISKLKLAWFAALQGGDLAVMGDFA